MAEEKSQPVYSLLIATETDSMLIPGGCVAEIVQTINLISEVKDQSSGQIGFISWRGTDLPLFSPEKLAGGEAVMAKQGDRAIILNRTSETCSRDFIALRVSAVPRSCRVADAEIHLDSENENSDCMLRLRWQGQPVILPDMEVIASLV
ncbi:chemotaxis protein CheW [Pelagibaculum spongiae]|uniref:CheW-like domain-containing protein n=1 Tax=Pelagibaculum spongiae TaxID=2080658 RepID=A0A2V1H0I3_9GAMM|nr:chemotaxis protein CheW [Pelagibaculum spongiae]PVZ72159.1 hypothetical protein DC094_03860 [Pelagibaculum spongiae]